MNILFVTYNTCARAAKEARALEAAGHSVLILQHVAASEEILYKTRLASFYRNNAEGLIKRICSMIHGFDVIHVHNEPNWIVGAAAHARNMSRPEVPVIFDIHDLGIMREDGEENREEEKDAVSLADGLIFPSVSYFVGIMDGFNVMDTMGPVPYRVIYSMCSRNDIVEDGLPSVNGIVYEGALVAPLMHFDKGTPGYKAYRDYIQLTRQLVVHNIPFHLYGCKKDFQPQYLSAGAIVHDYHPFPVMMKQLSRYKWGLCGHIENHPQWQKAMPNKLFEYLAAGIPVMAMNADEVSNFVMDNAVGVRVESLSDINRAYQDRNRYMELVENVEAQRHQWVMESQVMEIIALYEEAAAYRKSRLDDGVQLRHGAEGSTADGHWICFDGTPGCA